MSSHQPSSNGINSSSEINKERILCRFDLPGIRLVPTPGDARPTDRDDDDDDAPTTRSEAIVDKDEGCIRFTLDDLELVLKGGLDHLDDNDSVNNKGNDEETRHDDVPIEFKLKADVVWTNARRPYRPLHSFLGLLEDFEEEDEDALKFPCLLRTFVATNLDPAVTCSCNCPYPHAQWSQHQPNCSTPRNSNDAKRIIDWIDLTNLGDDNAALFPTPRSVMHFLRSLLGADQTASPWIHPSNDGNTGNENGRNATMKQTVLLDVVVLAVDPKQLRHEEDALKGFRVSDASPSWALHAIVPSWKVGNVSSDKPFPSPAGSSKCCSLLIYKRLPTRDWLRRRHIFTQEPSPVDDCLWETVRRAKKQEKDDNEQDDHTQAKWMHRLVAPPYLDLQVHYPEVFRILQENLPVLQQESRQIAHWTAWPEQQHYKVTSSDPNAGAPW